MLAKLSIRAKITLVIFLLLVAMTGMGLLAVTKMEAIYASATDIQTNWLPSVRALGDLRAEVNSFRNVVRAHMLSDTAEDKAAVDKRLVASAGRLARDRADYERMITSPEERALYNDWSEQWDIYAKGTQDVLALSQKSAGRVPREAQEMNERTLLPVAMKADALLIRDVEFNKQGADTAGKTAAESYHSAFTLLATILGASATLGIFLGIYLVRDVSHSIASIVKPMQMLGAGDLTAIVPHLGLKTEIGSMADSLQVFKEALIAKKATDAAAAIEADEKIQRGQRVDMITGAFEAMIGEIVETVSSASTELEASAGTLASTAERSQGLATTVAAASEEASTNVQSVASATEEMASSVNEISRQVQESARIADEAVDQARLCGSGLRGQGPGRADREGDRRDQPANRGHSGRHTPVGRSNQGNRRYDRQDVGDCIDHRRSRGTAGGSDARDFPQCSAGGAGHHAGELQYFRSATRRQ